MQDGTGATGKYRAPCSNVMKNFKMVKAGHYTKLRTLLSLGACVTAQVDPHDASLGCVSPWKPRTSSFFFL